VANPPDVVVSLPRRYDILRLWKAERLFDCDERTAAPTRESEQPFRDRGGQLFDEQTQVVPRRDSGAECEHA